MATKKAMEDKAAQLQADLDKLNAEIGTMKDDEPELKEGDWVKVVGENGRYSGLAVVHSTGLDRDGEITVIFGRTSGAYAYVRPRECTRIPFDVAKLVESMMALPCPDGYEWTGDVRAVDRFRTSSDFVLTGEGDVRSGASQEGRVRTNNCPRPILRKKA